MMVEDGGDQMPAYSVVAIEGRMECAEFAANIVCRKEGQSLSMNDDLAEVWLANHP